MPCRSSFASIWFSPRESCERSRRPIGGSGGADGGCGFAARDVLAKVSDFGAAALVTAGASMIGGFTSALAVRGFLRSGFVCLATLSHSARSSSLKPRLRRGGGAGSGIELEDGRFIGHSDNSGRVGGDAAPGPTGCLAWLPATAPAWRQPFGLPGFARPLSPAA